MKVLHVNTYDTGGAAIACIRQHLALLENGVDSYLLTLTKTRNDIPNHFSYYDVIKQDNPTVIKRILRKVGRKLNKSKANYKRNLAALQREATKTTDCFSFIDTTYRIDLIPGIDKYDIINLHWTAFFLDWKSFFTSDNVKNVVWTMHDMHPFTGGYHYSSGYDGYKNEDANPPFLVNTFNPGLAREQLNKKKKYLSDTRTNILITAPSKWLTDCSKESFLFSSFDHSHIPYSLNTETFKKLDKGFSRDTLNIPRNKRVILFVSEQIDNQRKGFKLLLEALAMPAIQDYTLCVIGRENKLDFGDLEVIRLGEIRDERLMSLAYNAADLFVLPSKEDNLPNVVLEALCCGTPVIGFEIGGMPDMVINQYNGMLSKEISASSLMESIFTVFDKYDSYNSEGIGKKASIEYSPIVQANNYRTVYKNLLKYSEA